MTAISEAPAAARRGPLARLIRTELTLFFREPAAPIFGIGLPLLILVIFGFIPSFKKVQPGYGGLTLMDAYVPILITMSLALLGLLMMPAGLVNYRERRVLRRLKTTPAGPVRVLSAQLIVNLSVGVATLIALLVVSRLAYDVPLPRQLGGWILTAVFALAALLGMGLFVAAVGPTMRATTGIGMLLFYPLMFFSGLWLPIPSMPSVLQHLSHATPLGAAWEAFQNADLGYWPPALALITMTIWAIVFGAAATRFFRWE